MNYLSDNEEFSSSFEIRESDLAGRLGTYTVNGRKVDTPELMPVVNPNKMIRGTGVPPRELIDKFGFKMVITNSYIIRRSEELRTRAEEEGLHKLLDYPGVIMTDSGTFQSYFYGGRSGKEVEVDPLDIVRFQNSIGSDVGTILDKFTVPDRDRQGAETDLVTTLDRAKASKDINSGMELAVPVQGGRHLDLRTRSGRSVYGLGIGYAPIGGVVPIMESYEYSLLVDVIVASKTGLGPSIPSHLFGAGHPMVLPLAAALGCDLFDSASYAKFAKDDRYMTRHRTMHLKEMENLPCSCPVCAVRDPKDLLDLEKDERSALVSRHNLWVLRDVINEIRGSIKEGTLWELVERSAMYNPSMFAAVRRLKEHSDHLEENAPRSTRRFMGSSGLSLARPEFTRMRNSLSEFEIPRSGKEKIMLTNWTITHSINVMDRMWTRQPEGAEPILATPFGLVPFDIIDMYPISQSLFPPPSSIDDEMRGYMEEMIELKRDDNRELIAWDGIEEPPFAPSKNDPHDLNTRKIRAILRFQFGKAGDRWVDDVLFTQGRELKIVTSRKTGKIRNVMEIDDQGGSAHLLSLRADDGLFNLRWEAARRLHESSSKPHFRVVVEEGTGEFNAKGYNVFCKFVLEVDPDIRAGDDVLIVDAEDTLYGVGRAAVSSRMMLESGSGTAVKTRDGAEKQ